MQAPPHACLLPVSKPSPARHAAPTAELLRQHLPGYAAFQDKHNARQRGAVRDNAWSPTLGLGWFGGEEWCDDRPQCVADQCRTHATNLPHGNRLR